MAELDNQIGVVASNLDVLSAKVQKVDANWGMVGSSASAALGVMVTALNKTNPVLSTILSGLQKVTPILTQIADAAKKSGASLKTALASSGVGLVVVALTSIIDVISRIKQKHDEQAQAARDAAEAEIEAARRASAAWDSFGDKYLSVDDKIAKARVKADKEAKNQAYIVQSWVNAWKSGAKTLEEAYKGIESQGKSLGVDEEGVKALQNYFELLVQKENEESDRRKKLHDEQMARIKAEKEAYEKMYSDLISSLKQYTDEASKGWDSIFSSAESALLASYKPGWWEELMGLDADSVSDFAENLGTEIADGLSKGFKDAAIATQEKTDAIVSGVSDAISSISTIFSNLQSYKEESLEQDLAQGKITQKEYERRKKDIKKFARASVIADTAAAIMGTWASYMKAPGGIPGAVLAGVQTAALGVTAGASLKAIDSETLGSSASPSSSAVSQGTTKIYTVNSSEDTSKITSAIESGTSKAADSKVVLVVEDLNKVTDNMTRASVESSF